MADGQPFQSHLLSMSAFGRRQFHLGVLYNYHSDTISSDQLSWSPGMIAAATRVDCTLEGRYTTDSDNEFTNDNKAGSVVGLDNHMQMSVMAGLIDSHQGACNKYMDDKPDPKQVTCTLICKVISREEKLDLLSLVNYKVPQLDAAEETEATHVVSSIFYGAETYCILARDVGEEADEEIRKEIVKDLSKLANKWMVAINQFVALNEFKGKLSREEKHFNTSVQCRLYSDFQSQPDVQCGFYSAFQQVFEIMHDLFSVPKGSCLRKAVPITIQLCPLQILLDATQGAKIAKVKNCDINATVVAEGSRLLSGLKRVIIRAGKMSSNCSINNNSTLRDSIEKFVDLVSKYRSWVETKLKKNIVAARQNNFLADRYLNCAIYDTERNITLFKPSRLENWIRTKQGELNRMKSMEHAAGTDIVILPGDRKRLREQLDGDDTKKYSVVLQVPRLDEKTSSELSDMQRYITKIKNSFCGFLKIAEKGDKGEPWHSDVIKLSLVMDKIRQLASHVERNKSISINVQFIIYFGGKSDPFDCSYFLFEGSCNCSHNFNRLPEPPAVLRISLPDRNRTAKRAKTSCSLVHVEWDHEDLGYPCQYLIEYRVKGSFNPWIQQRTTHPGQDEMSISVETGSVTEIRIAVESCIGRSEFSDIFDTSSVFDDGNNVEHIPDFNVDILGGPLELSTASVVSRFADKLTRHCHKIDRENGMDLYAVPLTKSNGDGSVVVRYEFGQQRLVDSRNTPKPRSILLIGQSDSDKLAVINAIINYVFDVDFADPFRFQLIKKNEVEVVEELEEEESEIEKKEDPKIFVYDFHYTDGFRIPYSLTIIDVPSYVDNDSEKNKYISCSIRHIFSSGSKFNQEVDMVGFFMDSLSPQLTLLHHFIYCSLMTVFGSKIKENLNFIFNCADGQNLPLLTAVSEAGLVTGQPLNHTFNGSAVFHSNIDVENFENFQLCMDNLVGFFSSLATTPKSMSVDKQGRVEFKRLEATVIGLERRIMLNMIGFKDMRNTKRNLDWNNVNKEFKTNVEAVITQYRAVGEYATSCVRCLMTCHEECGNKGETFDCDVMDHSAPVSSRTCRVCECPWNFHQNGSVTRKPAKMRRITTTATVQNSYGRKLRKNLTAKEVVKELEKDIALKKRVVVEQVEAILRYIKRSIKIGLHVHPYSKPVFANIRGKVSSALNELIAAENLDKGGGFAERERILEEFHQFASRGRFYPWSRLEEDETQCVLERVDNLRPFDLHQPEEKKSSRTGSMFRPHTKVRLSLRDSYLQSK